MQISQIEITGFSYGVLNFVVSFKTQKNSMAKKYVCKYHQSDKGKKKLPKMKSLMQSLSNRPPPPWKKNKSMNDIIIIIAHYRDCWMETKAGSLHSWFKKWKTRYVLNTLLLLLKLNVQGSSTRLISEIPLIQNTFV